nr:hypothetical protein [Tanacetum cinerariifolium]
ENDCREDGRLGRFQAHDVERAQGRNGDHEQRGHDGEVLGHVVGNRKRVIDAGFFGNEFGGERVVAGYHHGFDAHAAQALEALLNAGLDDVLQLDHAQNAVVFAHYQRRATVAGHVGYVLGRLVGEGLAGGVGQAADGVGLVEAAILARQLHDALALGRFVVQRGQHGGFYQLAFAHAGGGPKVRGLAVADGDGAGFVEQQH